MFVCLVTRERFGLAHAPLLSQRHSNFRVLRVSVNLACVFVCLVTGSVRACPCTSPFPNAFKILSLMCKHCLCVRASCVKGAFGLAHAPLLSKRRSNLCLPCVNLAFVFVCLVTRERSCLPMHLSFHKDIQIFVSHL